MRIGFVLAVLLSLRPATIAEVKVQDHVLGESAKQFFSEGHEGDALRACASGDFKSVNQPNKKAGKEYCTKLSDSRQSLTVNGNGKYKADASGDSNKTITYIFLAGKFVAAEITFISPDPTNSYHGKSFDEIIAGLRGAYGPPASETTASLQGTYGAPYQARRELWLGDAYAIEAAEQPTQSGATGWTSVNVSTRELYDKLKANGGPKPANPLDK